MTTELTEEAFLEHIRRTVASSGINPAAQGFRLACAHEGRKLRWNYGRDADAGVNNVIWLSFPRLLPDVADHCVRAVRRWWSEEKERRALAAATEAVFGHGDLPYLVDDVILNHFAQRGMPFEDFIAAMRRRFGGGNVERQLRRGDNLVFSTFLRPAWVPEAFIPYRWRSPDVYLGGDFAALGDIQFRLSGSGGYGMIAYFEVAPGAFWCGGPSPRLWLRQHRLPQTLMSAARKRRLTDVVNHPTLDVEGLTIRTMTQESERYSKTDVRERISIAVSSIRSDVTTRTTALPLAA